MYFDEATLQQLQSGYKPTPKSKKKKNPLTALISEGAATGGAVGGAALGTAILPGIGTAVGGILGGLAGGFGGSATEQKIRDDKIDWGKATLEGAIGGASALPPLGVLRGVKAARSARGTMEEVLSGPRNIPVKFMPSEAVGTGVRQTSNNTLTNPTISALTDAVGAMRNNGFKVNQKLGSTKGSTLPDGVGVTPDFTPLKRSPSQTSVALMGNKTSIKFGDDINPNPVVLRKPQSDTIYKRKNSLADALKIAAETATTRGAPAVKQNRLTETATRVGQEGSGLTVGQSMGRGQVLTPDKADEVFNFINTGSQKYGGIRAGKPINQARDAQNVYKNVVSSLDEALKGINRPVTGDETKTIFSNALTKVTDSPAVTGATKTLEKFGSKMQAAGTDLTKLEKIRREADDLAFTSTGAGKTSAAAQAKAVRDAIDEFITPLSPQYKAVKGDYSLAKDALDATSKANKSAKGINIPFMNTEVGRQIVPGVKNRAAQAATNLPSRKPSNPMSPLNMAKRQAIGSTVFGIDTPQTDEAGDVQAGPMMTDQVGMGALPSERESNLPDAAQVQQDIQQILASGGDMKDAAQYVGLVQALQEMEGSSQQQSKPLSAEASKIVSNANSGLASLSQLEAMIQNGGVPAGTLLPGRSMFGGLGSALVGTSSYDTAARNIADVITRLRTGAALTEQEEAFYKSQLPQAFDPPETVAQKLSMFRDLFSSVGSRTGSSATDLQAALAGL